MKNNDKTEQLTELIIRASNTVSFEFGIKQRVQVKELSRPGIITGLMVETDGGLIYRVAYWNNGDRKIEWLFAEELDPA